MVRKNKKRVLQNRHIFGLVLTCAAVLVIYAVLILRLPKNPPEDFASELPPVQTEPDSPVGIQDTEAERVQAALTAARAGNSDVAGWLTVDGAEIDDPVAQAADNDKYLRRTIESADYDLWGCYFFDYECVVSDSDALCPVTIIYGHALYDDPDAQNFSKLKRYMDEAFAAAHPEITLGLDGGMLRFEVFSVSNVPITINYIDPTPDRADFQATLDYFMENSFVSPGVSVGVDDKILILSTCTSDPNIRFVVAGKLVEKTG